MTSENGLETLKSWVKRKKTPSNDQGRNFMRRTDFLFQIKSKEENLREKNEIIEDLKRQTDELRHEIVAVRTQLTDIQ